MQHIAQAITELRNWPVPWPLPAASGDAPDWLGAGGAPLEVCGRLGVLTAVERLQARAAFGGGR